MSLQIQAKVGSATVTYTFKSGKVTLKKLNAVAKKCFLGTEEKDIIVIGGAPLEMVELRAMMHPDGPPGEK